MSMNVLTILQFLQILTVYLIMTLLLPSVLLYSHIKKLKFSARFMVYQMVGNFYMMSIVFLLQLLHISNRVTLILFTAVPYGVAYVVLKKRHPVKMAKKALNNAERLAGGQFGKRLFMRRVRTKAFRSLRRMGRRWLRSLGRNFFDLVLVAALTAGLCYAYGSNLLFHYGYCESDLPVHNYWINYLSQNKIFVAGIYPFGFHCVIYYLHEVFGIATFVLLRVFCFVQTIMIHYMLLAFTKSCCKSKFAPYVGVYIYTMLGIFGENTYIRYHATLPQEYGMLFILPSIYVLFAFFEKRGKREKEDFWYLAGFAVSFSMTLSAHFYDTMIAGLLCVGVAVGYCFRLFRRKYFGKVMLAGFLAIVIAVFPMGVAFAMGTPLQGSLGWGLNVIMGRNNKTNTTTTTTTERVEEDSVEEDTQAGGADTEAGSEVIEPAESTKAGNRSENSPEGEKSGRSEPAESLEADSQAESTEAGDQSENSPEGEKSGRSEPAESTEADSRPENTKAGARSENLPEEDSTQKTARAESESKPGGSGAAALSAKGAGVLVAAGGASFPQKIGNVLRRAYRGFWDAMRIYVIGDSYPVFQYAVPLSMALLALLAAIFFLLRRTDYAARFLSMSAGLVMLAILQGSSRMGLPTLMDAIRTCIFFSYVLAAVWGMCADGILELIFGWFKKKWMLHLASMAVLAALIVTTSRAGLLRPLPDRKALQTNDAILCLTNILHDNEDFTWTICSANDELRMGEDYGYHYEVHTFLKEMENKGSSGKIIIPTPRVYFFIEKVPVTFARAYEGGEPVVSVDAATMRLPLSVGISMYKGNNRWIEMSRLYYWAQKFMEIYPNEMTVYYESDNFVCYCVEQDMYSLFNFSIDYGYNMLGTQ